MGGPQPSHVGKGVAVKPGLYEARSVDTGLVAYVYLDDGERLSEARMRAALRQIADRPRSSRVGQVARWALGDMGED